MKLFSARFFSTFMWVDSIIAITKPLATAQGLNRSKCKNLYVRQSSGVNVSNNHEYASKTNVHNSHRLEFCLKPADL